MDSIRTGDFRALCGRLGLRLLVLLVAALLLVKCGGLLFSVLLPFLAALLLAWLFNPLIRFLQRKFGGTRRIWAVVSTAVIMLLLAVGLSAIIYVAYTQIRDFFTNAPTMIADFFVNLQQAFNRAAELLNLKEVTTQRMETGLQWLIAKLTDWLNGWTPQVLEGAGSVLTTAANVLITAAVFVLASCYIMGDYPRLHYFSERYLPAGLRDGLGKLKRAASSAIGGYFKAQFILSAIVAAICFVVLLAMGQSGAVLIAIVIGIVDFIPVFGSGTILVPWAVILLLTGSYQRALIFIVLAAALFLLRKVAEPRVVGGQTGLPTLLSLICIYVGMRLGGVLGMILAPVLCMMFINLYHLGMFDNLKQDCRDFSGCISEILAG
jgi:sporulation integral membrane protein YtvI